MVMDVSGEPSGTINVRIEADAVVLLYRARSFLAGWNSIEQRIPITWTNCHFGGRRPWFVCSVRANDRYCGRRVAVLYAAGELFACRCCCGLVYASQQKNPLFEMSAGRRKCGCGLAALRTCSVRCLRDQEACGAAPMSAIVQR